jgi:hypothetical protein
VNNSRWKTIQSWEQLERLLKGNPHLRVYDTHDRESRYVIRQSVDDNMTCATVDGRAFNAICFTACEQTHDGGYKLRRRLFT